MYKNRVLSEEEESESEKNKIILNDFFSGSEDESEDDLEDDLEDELENKIKSNVFNYNTVDLDVWKNNIYSKILYISSKLIIKSIPYDIFSDNIFNTKLEILSICNNDLRELPETLLNNCSQLKSLIIENNKIKKLPDKLLKYNTKLKYISFDGNKLKKLPVCLFYNCPELNTLILNNNDLINIDQYQFVYNNNLEEIGLKNNKKLSLNLNKSNTVSTLFRFCYKLKKLNIDYIYYDFIHNSILPYSVLCNPKFNININGIIYSLNTINTEYNKSIINIIEKYRNLYINNYSCFMDDIYDYHTQIWNIRKYAIIGIYLILGLHIPEINRID